ncbi:MAG TPA: regulatory iron-sulfur-containing complex subunit RicT [Candidatus Acidoferrales bacterium]|nr:regulatory iron-sulfur-containing complex subunit RicT [Candidatus Acidoferrales bacterium]
MDSERHTETVRSTNLVGVQFTTAGSIHRYEAGTLALQSGDRVVVEMERGTRLGTVIALPRAAALDPAAPSHRVIKKADTRDVEKDDRNRIREHDALRICLHRLRERDLKMKLVKAEQAFDGGKIVFYFSADGRVDFRDLVRELAHVLHTRVEMKQIGARDEAKQIGALGPCGRELCCSSFLRDPGGVSMKMAKAQGLSPNPSKLAGMCGRLKCCLRYEYDTYLELGRTLPALGTRVVSVKGDGVVTRQNLLRQTVVIRRDDGADTEATLDDLVGKKPE